MKLRKIITVATAGTAAASISLFGLGLPAAHADNGVQPVTFEVSGGFLTLAQTPVAPISLMSGAPVNMPVTAITDGRNNVLRTGVWTVTATVSALTDIVLGGSIPSLNIALGQSGSFTSGTGTVGVLGLVSASLDSIDSVYTYTPTATLTLPAHPNSGSYTGSITQTVV